MIDMLNIIFDIWIRNNLIYAKCHVLMSVIQIAHLDKQSHNFCQFYCININTKSAWIYDKQN